MDSHLCLANISQVEVPDSDERASLQLSGLGEKRIILNAYSEMHDIYDKLLFQFPKLKQGGGFELLKCYILISLYAYRQPFQ